MSQTIQCPKCLTSYEVEEISYGAKFQCGNCGEYFTAVEAKSSSDIFCSDRTIAPRNIHIAKPDESYNESITMPGHRDAKPAGRFGVGDLILRRYKVLAELGQGGMGVVYKCFDETAGIEVALKALPPELSHNTLEMEDVKENFQLVSRLVHQNIAIYRNLEKESVTGNYYLIMECVDGEDLRRWIKRKRKDGSLTIDSILPVIRQIASALDYAHEQKIIHRDIKPGNIMIDVNGRIKVLDFGLAAQIHTSMTHVSMAYHGTSGTGPYMAPEQWRGRAQGAAADQYALAVMTYEMLAGHLPFESSDASVLREAVLNETAEEIEEVPTHVWNAINRAMSKDPKMRFESCTAFAEALCGEKPAEEPKKEESSAQTKDDILKTVAGYRQQKRPSENDIRKKNKAWKMIAIILTITVLIGIKIVQNMGAVSSRTSLGGYKTSETSIYKAPETKPVNTNSSSLNLNAEPTKTIALSGTVSLDLVKVEAGSFTMSANDGENYENEVPHTATLTQDFYIGKYEVTQEQWKAVMGGNPSNFKGDKLPVESVSWHDAMDFCEKLNKSGKAPSGYHFTLPTETQWEYAAKGGKKSKGYKYSGSNTVGEVAWYEGNSGDKTHEAGTKAPNELGLYDMSGNVLEWCLDDWTKDSREAKEEFTRGKDSSSSRRVLRGGSWSFNAWSCRAASRGRDDPSDTYFSLGFRVALAPGQN